MPAQHTSMKFANPYLAGVALGLVLLASFVVMGKGHGVANLHKDGHEAGDVEFLNCLLVPIFDLPEDLFQSPAPDHLHGVKDLSAGLDAEFVDRDDIGVFQLASDLGLLHKTQQGFGAFLSLLQHYLDSDQAADVDVFGSQDHTHTALGQHLFYVVFFIVGNNSLVIDQRFLDAPGLPGLDQLRR